MPQPDWAAALAAVSTLLDGLSSRPDLSPAQQTILVHFGRLATRYYALRDPLLFDLVATIESQIRDVWKLSLELKPPAEPQEDLARLDSILATRDSITAKAGPWHKGSQTVTGTVPCPRCGKTVRWRRAGSNGHVHASCETKGCLSWME